MKEEIKEFKKYSAEDIKFFDALAEEYGLEQDAEFLIVNKDGKKTFIPKAREIPTKSGSVKIRELIERAIKEE